MSTRGALGAGPFSCPDLGHFVEVDACSQVLWDNRARPRRPGRRDQAGHAGRWDGVAEAMTTVRPRHVGGQRARRSLAGNGLTAGRAQQQIESLLRPGLETAVRLRYVAELALAADQRGRRVGQGGRIAGQCAHGDAAAVLVEGAFAHVMEAVLGVACVALSAGAARTPHRRALLLVEHGGELGEGRHAPVAGVAGHDRQYQHGAQAVALAPGVAVVCHLAQALEQAAQLGRLRRCRADRAPLGGILLGLTQGLPGVGLRFVQEDLLRLAVVEPSRPRLPSPAAKEAQATPVGSPTAGAREARPVHERFHFPYSSDDTEP